MRLVFEAEQQHPRRSVALKVIRGERCLDDHHVRLFQREAQALARLKHPGIAGIHEAGRTEDGQHFFAMELVNGDPLFEYLRKRPGDLPWKAGWTKVFPTSKSGFIGFVDGAGMHKATKDKAVTLSFLTDDVDVLFTHMKSREALESFELRHQEVLDEGFVRVFVGYDPENYFLEFDQFVEHEDNVDFLRVLAE